MTPEASVKIHDKFNKLNAEWAKRKKLLLGVLADMDLPKDQWESIGIELDE